MVIRCRRFSTAGPSKPWWRPPPDHAVKRRRTISISTMVKNIRNCAAKSAMNFSSSANAIAPTPNTGARIAKPRSFAGKSGRWKPSINVRTITARPIVAPKANSPPMNKSCSRNAHRNSNFTTNIASIITPNRISSTPHPVPHAWTSGTFITRRIWSG